MPAKRIYRDVSPPYWDHPNAGKVQDAYDRSRREAAMPPERGAFKDPPRSREFRVPLERDDMRRLPTPYKPDPASVKNGRLKRLPTKDFGPVRNPYKPHLPNFSPMKKMLRYPFSRTPLGRVWDAVDLWDGWVKNPNPTSPSEWMPPGGTRVCAADPLTAPPRWPAITHLGIRGGFTNPTSCGLGLQAWIGANSITSIGNFNLPATLIPLEDDMNFWHGNYPATSLSRFRYAEVWWFPGSGTWTNANGQAPFVTTPFIPADFMDVDPNYQRERAEKNIGPALAGVPHISQQPDIAPHIVATPDLTQGSEPWAFSGGVRVPPVGRTPTQSRPGERERKVIARSAKIAKWLFKALDNISEGAELVDCAFSALPAAAQKRWKKCNDNSGFTIAGNLGQYGLDGAHCKSRAIYHNVKDMDVNKFLNCAALNHLEDAFYGAMHKVLPVNTGAALDPSMKELADWIDYVETELGIKLE